MPDAQEEYSLFVMRYMQFHNLWTVYSDFRTGRYVPSVPESPREDPQAYWQIKTDMKATLMFMLYAFFYSLIEDDPKGLNAFRIWKLKYPDEQKAISALERLILPFHADLKDFRNRLGFHGSRSHEHEARGLDVFKNFSGGHLLHRMVLFKALNAALIEKDMARQSKLMERQQAARLKIDEITARCEASAT
jgi:hypothetical protein